MQLFGLVNSMLAADHATAERDLSIARYAVIPLSPNSGLIGWVPNCDTLHALIREYRCVGVGVGVWGRMLMRALLALEVAWAVVMHCAGVSGRFFSLCFNAQSLLSCA